MLKLTEARMSGRKKRRIRYAKANITWLVPFVSEACLWGP